MKTSIGGDRLGSGNKAETAMKNYSRSTHDLSYIWRSSMASGTLVPFMSELALPGDSWDINLNCEILTLPTIGPLFGSYKVQLDVFQAPIRLYNAGLHMNRLGIGMDMSAVKLPQVQARAMSHVDAPQTYEDNSQINSSCIFKYLGISGLGSITGTPAGVPIWRWFNAVPYLGYWEIYKNYYANKQEERGVVMHTTRTTAKDILRAYITINFDPTPIEILDTVQSIVADASAIINIIYPENSLTPKVEEVYVNRGGVQVLLVDIFDNVNMLSATNLRCTGIKTPDTIATTWECPQQQTPSVEGGGNVQLEEFPLSNIDDMREAILQHPFASGVFNVEASSLSPYSLPMQSIGAGAEQTYGMQYTQEGLGIKTYQSDLFNNWISTEWIDGPNGINEVTSVSTVGDAFTIDALNLANKVYNMLNRIAISGGTYDDWLDAVYTHERSKSVESPIYHGSLIKELSFQEVISTADTQQTGAGGDPLGTLAGRGKLTSKTKGGKMIIKVDEPSYIIGIVSLTPRIDYSQGNKFDMNLKTLNDLHKPSLDAIGYQDLITDQMAWQDTEISQEGAITYKSAGKQPAWINYMTALNRVYGHFAERNDSMFMVLNRRYDISTTGAGIEDLTTYVDPTKFNHIFAETSLDAQNFWVQIGNNITSRRKMSAKVIPNL